MSIINPIGFGNDVVAWADQMSYLIFKDEAQFERIKSPETWRDWAMQVVGSQDRLGQDSPDPRQFKTWQEWAERLFQTQDFT